MRNIIQLFNKSEVETGPALISLFCFQFQSRLP